jgi:hypothetical protein
MRAVHTDKVGPYTITHLRDHGFSDAPDVMYRYSGDDVRSTELFRTWDHAMAAAIAARHMGKPTAFGPGVGTAADFFMKMIGA